MEQIAAGCFLLVLLIILCVGARGESAWVQTGKGTLNMRSRADEGASVVLRIPNGDAVGLLEAGEEWSRIAYQGKEGYAKSSFLLFARQMIDRPIYSEDGRMYPWESLEESEAKQVYAFLNARSLVLGDVLDIAVQRPPDTLCTLTMWLDGRKLFDAQPLVHDQVSYRPRACGSYRMEILASLPDGHAVGFEADFTVSQHVSSGNPTAFTLCSQKDGWWLDQKYGKSNLDQSGCAIFTLSHALALLGIQSQETSPQALALAYPMYLTESGTVTGNLLAAAGRKFGFRTGADKISNRQEIIQRFEEGAVFSFSVVQGHIALAAELSEDRTMVRVIDSAPSATFERIEHAAMYYPDEQGRFHQAQSLWDIPGARYYFETDDFGGVEYYLELSYAAGRGMRMILPVQ